MTRAVLTLSPAVASYEAPVNQPFFRNIWGGATGWLDRSRTLGWFDLVFVLALAALVVGLWQLAAHWGAPPPQSSDEAIQSVSLSPWTLPLYTFYSLMRGVIAYGFSLLFTLVYGYWAAKDRVAQRVLIPLLDILQSIPVLGFAPFLLLVFVKAFPSNNVGLELAVIVSIFTGQAWNMTFSFYQSVRSVPTDMHEAATVYRFSWWRRFKWVELPFSAIGLIWNSMMSFAGGWFFLSVVEALDIGKDAAGNPVHYWSPGIGSYITKASLSDPWDWAAMFAGVFAMTIMIVALDQLLWRPVVAWAQKFRVEEGGAQEATTSWFLDLLRRSRLVNALLEWLGRLLLRREGGKTGEAKQALADPTQASPVMAWVSRGLFVVLVGVLIYGAWCLVQLILLLHPAAWGVLLLHALYTLLRVLAAVAVGTLWALPAGLAIGLSPRLSRVLQPVVQVLASFPAPLFFPFVILGLQAAGVTLDWGSVVLMLLGTQWYILFNVIAGAMAVPADLKEAARSYNITGWRRFKILYFPALFPFLVTGWVTAAGGAWNASIVAEIGHDSHGQTLAAQGLGADIMKAADGEPDPGGGEEAAATKDANYPYLAASVLVMSTVVVVFNRLVWRKCYHLAETRFSITR
jgi:NitT/TauT family transport system permease protein